MYRNKKPIKAKIFGKSPHHCVAKCLIKWLGMRGWTNISHTQGGANIFHTQGEDKHFCILGGTNIFVGGGGTYDDDDEEIDVSEANIFVSEASKLSAGDRIFRGP